MFEKHIQKKWLSSTSLRIQDIRLSDNKVQL